MDSQGQSFETPIHQLDWAVQFRMLQAARLAAIQPDLWVIGMDHFPTNSSWILELLADEFGFERYQGDFLHAPLLFADGDKKLSKTHGSAIYVSPHTLIDLLRNNRNFGVDMELAPVSSDIIAVGSELLPGYMLQDKGTRLVNLDAERKKYDASDKPQRFARANARGAVSDQTVANTLGVPHL
jgi:hypothetical protein